MGSGEGWEARGPALLAALLVDVESASRWYIRCHPGGVSRSPCGAGGGVSRSTRLWPCLQLLQWGLFCPFLIATHLILQELNPSLHLAGVTLGWAGPHRLDRPHLSCRLRALVWTRCRRTMERFSRFWFQLLPWTRGRMVWRGPLPRSPPAPRIPCRPGASRAGPRAVSPCACFCLPLGVGNGAGSWSGCGGRWGLGGAPHSLTGCVPSLGARQVVSW